MSKVDYKSAGVDIDAGNEAVKHTDRFRFQDLMGLYCPIIYIIW